MMGEKWQFVDKKGDKWGDLWMTISKALYLSQ